MTKKNIYSVIIPTLNEEKLLPKLLSQFTPEIKEKYHIELILADGGSIDNTIEIALGYVDTIIKNNGLKENIAIGRNKGAEVANGDVLVFLNGDIYLQDINYFFHHLNEYFINSDHVAMTVKVKIFPEEEIRLDKIYHYCYNKYFKFLNNFGIGMGRGECQIIKRKPFFDEKGYNCSLAAGEDFDLFRRLKKKGNILFEEKLIVFESPRRFRKYGYFNVTLSWIKNGFSVFFKNKSLSKVWEEVR